MALAPRKAWVYPSATCLEGINSQQSLINVQIELEVLPRSGYEFRSLFRQSSLLFASNLSPDLSLRINQETSSRDMTLSINVDNLRLFGV